jgi:hypothetical protein
MSMECILTKRGERAMPDGMDPVHALILEIMKRTKRIDRENLVGLTMRLAALFGSAEDAITALKSGAARLEKDTSR